MNMLHNKTGIYLTIHENFVFQLLKDDYTYNGRILTILCDPWLKGCLIQLITVPIFGKWSSMGPMTQSPIPVTKLDLGGDVAQQFAAFSGALAFLPILGLFASEYLLRSLVRLDFTDETG